MPPSLAEAIFYYAGLPSGPPLIARTGSTVWTAPTGREAYRRTKQLRAVGTHALVDVWEADLAVELHAVLDEMKVKWTSTDAVRIGYVGEPFAPVIVWIGVAPGSLSSQDGAVVASRCKRLLEERYITDVDIELRESTVIRLAGPKLLAPSYSFDGAIDIREPLTTTLGLPISPQSTPWNEGTAGFFIAEGVRSTRLLLVTARHVVFAGDREPNELFEHTDGQLRRNITLFGDTGFNKYLQSIQDAIRSQKIAANYHGTRLTAFERDSEATDHVRKAEQVKLDDVMETMEHLNIFYREVSTYWATQESRIIGHVVLSPPINVGVGRDNYMEDWAVIEVDPSKVDDSNLEGNAIDLGTRISFHETIRMMIPNYRDANSFTYPDDRFLRFKGAIPEEEMRYPNTLDEDNEPCLMVIKRGHGSALTIGRANNLYSYVRHYHNNGSYQTSKEWAILPLDSKSGPFATLGDSGSIIVDRLGRVGGLLTSGTGAVPSSPDISYATPFRFLLERMQSSGLHIL
ncbi:hypothetical protein BDW22DRAFT_1355569 [Trametopsis cervina]|nr:hypothetical protein BDW22DRAFT_1355569 [Trametopsis cervina]